MATVPILNGQLDTVTQDVTRAIMLDLRDLTFIDSSGLHALVRAYRRCEEDGPRLLVLGANPFARRLCQMTGTEFLLDAEGTAELLGRFTGDGSRPGTVAGETGAEPHA
jgi:anti-anti-sigma factor